MGRSIPRLEFISKPAIAGGRAVHRSTISEILSDPVRFSELDKNQATLKVLVRPLVVWIWIGGFVIALGTLLAILPLGKTSPEAA